MVAGNAKIRLIDRGIKINIEKYILEIVFVIEYLPSRSARIVVVVQLRAASSFSHAKGVKRAEVRSHHPLEGGRRRKEERKKEKKRGFERILADSGTARPLFSGETSTRDKAESTQLPEEHNTREIFAKELEAGSNSFREASLSNDVESIDSQRPFSDSLVSLAFACARSVTLPSK